ncbi:MAG: Gfo/Idh/MocA family oxidoreductase [Clostridia bacterium]
MAILKSSKAIRVAVIGCGTIGNLHIDNLLKSEGIEIIALYNRGIENLEKAGKKVPKARMYQDVTKMLLKEKIDVAIISVMPTNHGEIEELCCKKGIHMFIENPVAFSYDIANKINEAIKYSNVLVSVDFQERYSSPIDIVRQILQTEVPCGVSAYCINSMPTSQWKRLKEQSGGQILEQSTHVIDMLRYLFGEVDLVYATARNDQRLNLAAHTISDHSSMVLSFKSGEVATLQTGCYIKNELLQKVGFDIITPRCMISYECGKSLTVTSGERTEKINILQDNKTTALETFIKAVKSNDGISIKSDYQDAIASLNVSLMANKSIETAVPEKIL